MFPLPFDEVNFELTSRSSQTQVGVGARAYEARPHVGTAHGAARKHACFVLEGLQMEKVGEMPVDDAEEASTVRKLSDMSHELRDLYLGRHVETVHVDDIDPLVFYREYVARNKPVLIRGAVDHWPALHKWNDAYLCEAMDVAPVTVNWTPDGLADAVKQVDGEAHFVLPHEERMTYEAFLSHLARTRADPALGVPYCSYQNDSLRAEFSAVAADVEESLSWADRAFGQPPEAVNFWAGDERSVTTYHQDPYENLYVVLRGEKIFTLLPPEDVWRMYVQERPCAKHVRREDGTYEAVRVEPTQMVPWSHVDPYPDPSQVQDHCRCVFRRVSIRCIVCACVDGASRTRCTLRSVQDDRAVFLHVRKGSVRSPAPTTNVGASVCPRRRPLNRRSWKERHTRVHSPLSLRSGPFRVACGLTRHAS